MNINIKATNMELTSAIRDFTEKKISGLGKFIGRDDDAIKVFVEVGITTRHHHSGNIFRAEIQITAPHIEKGVRTEAVDDDLYTAIEKAKDEMKLELTKIKDRKISLIRRGVRAFRKFIPFLGE
ncbi:MAG: ribosome-associated translation inhibitor RaiA [Candidatus Paceibacterota bacterium]